MSKSPPKAKQTKEPFVPKLDINAAQKLQHSLPAEPNILESFSMFVMMFTMFGTQKADPMYNWAAWFILLSMVINRDTTSTPITQSLISFIVCTVSTGVLYYRMTRGYTAH